MAVKRISIVLPNLSGGGAERLHVQLANYWNSKGIKVELVVMRETGEFLDLLAPDIQVFDLKINRFRDLVWPFYRYLRNNKPSITLVAMWPLTSLAIIAWLMSGRVGKMFVSEHVNWSAYAKYDSNISLKHVSLLMKFTYCFANKVIAVSEGVKKDICHLIGIKDSDIRVIYNPISSGSYVKYLPVAEREKLWGGGFTYHILSVGTLKDQKDHATLIRSFAIVSKLMNAKLTILGEGYLKNKLQKLIFELGLENRITLAGFVMDPYPWYRSADLFVLSSVYEGFGNVIVEALECGVTVVSTDCLSGPSEILKDGGVGYLVPMQDAKALSKGIIKGLKDPFNRRQMMERANDFSVSAISANYLNCFSK